MTQSYNIAVEDGIATVTLNRPEVLNAINDSIIFPLIEDLEKIAQDPAIRVVILTGAGRAFSAGGDVKAMKGNANPMSYEDRVGLLRRRHELSRVLYEFPKVTIAMVNGVAAGAGFALSLACDFRLAARSAKFVTSFVTVGFAGDFGGTYFLTRLLGPSKAKELFLTSEKLDAERALSLGIVSKVVEDDALVAETRAFARTFADGAVLAHGYIKRNFRAAETGTLQDVLDLEAFHQIRLAVSEDHTEAVNAFQEKRRPVFKGR
ncbi:enoyl-CoA hydratase/isomerase family protein [Oryzicola mucosus]|uniref:Enoyl-CoA hydratase n=1 Tax=Oryzicola mucosus TaxID=2767425 RepID=A0A8J6U1U1_9HYPH|nr:enoyl-CoA hydratase [Oryzicola mucosus]MBD0417326.1 enoyl-CoA hydratase [Oryzicola mucosus]